MSAVRVVVPDSRPWPPPERRNAEPARLAAIEAASWHLAQRCPACGELAVTVYGADRSAIGQCAACGRECPAVGVPAPSGTGRVGGIARWMRWADVLDAEVALAAAARARIAARAKPRGRVAA